MAALPKQKVLRTGAATVYTAASAADTFVANPNTIIIVKNAHGSINTNVTIDSQVACDQGADHNEVVAVNFGTEKVIGPFPERFRDANGAVHLAFSSFASVTVAVLEP